MKYLAHLAKRFISSLSPRRISETELDMVCSALTANEYALWNRFSKADRRHSVDVVKRFLVLCPDASRHERAGVLLHDIGKIESNLSTMQRVLATVIGPRTKRFEQYHQHVAIGADLLRRAGSHDDVLAIVDQTCSADTAAAFRAADNI